MSQESFLKTTATVLGFDACRICRADETWSAGARLEAFVDAGHHGEMEWMETTLTRRKAPTAMWDGAKSAVIVALNYGPQYDPMHNLNRKREGNISVYARGKDYHDIVKKRLKRVARWLVAETDCEVKVFVDTAPVPEKALGQAAGLGWQGKHTNLVSRDLGNWFFLGVIFTTADLPPDTKGEDHCGTCRKCLDICPTDAFPAPYQLDARLCISYLTIEHKGPIDEPLRSKLGNRIYGCDDCLAVCPWNKFAQTARDARYAARGNLDAPPLSELARLDDATFREKFSGSPIKRTGRDRFVRNVLYAIGNSGDPGLAPEAERLTHDPDATVADAARWAALRLKGHAR